MTKKEETVTRSDVPQEPKTEKAPAPQEAQHKALINEMATLAKMQCSDEEILATIHLATKVSYKELEQVLDDNRQVKELIKHARLAGRAEVKRKRYVKGIVQEDMKALDQLDVKYCW